VLSTLHTNDAPNSVTRLLDMGMEAYKIASALRGIIAQRLLRQLCPVCKEVLDTPLPPYMLRYIPEKSTLYKPVGCKECANTGYRGRFAITETMVDAGLEALIGGGGTADKITVVAREQGYGRSSEAVATGPGTPRSRRCSGHRYSDRAHAMGSLPLPKSGTKPGAPRGRRECSRRTGHHDGAFELIGEPLDLGGRGRQGNHPAGRMRTSSGGS
jgi:hypothetical protein